MNDLNISALYLCKNVPFNNTYETTIDFDDQTKQLAFFNSYVDQTFDEINTTYLRLNKNISVGTKLDNLFGINYCYLQNVSDGKWYFYFIVDKQYVNENCTRLFVEMDVYQTFMFDYSLGECFINREHQDRYESATAFKFNLEPENVEVGNEMKVASISKLGPSNTLANSQYYKDIMWYYVWSGDALTNETADSFTCSDNMPTNLHCYLIPFYKGIKYPDYDGIAIIGCSYNEWVASGYSGKYIMYLYAQNPNIDSGKVHTTNKTMEKIAENPYVYQVSLTALPPENISLDIREVQVPSYYNLYCFFYKPSDNYQCLEYKWGTGTRDHSGILNCLNTSLTPITIYNPLTINLKTTSGRPVDYTANKNILYEPKLLTYPYTKFSLVCGDSKKELKPELIESNTIKYVKSVYPQGTTVLYNESYNNNTKGYTGKAVAPFSAKVPTRNDPFEQFWATSKNSYWSGMITNAISGAIGGVSGGLAAEAAAGPAGAAVAAVGGAVNAASGIANSIAKIQDLKAAPDTVNAGDDPSLYKLYEEYCPFIIKEELLPQFKNRLFNYLYRYGYACNNFKVPDLRSRYWFNFIKMEDINFTLNKIDSDYLDQLKAIYQNGTTIWHYRGDGTSANIATYKTNNLLQYGKENVEMSSLS